MYNVHQIKATKDTKHPALKDAVKTVAAPVMQEPLRRSTRAVPTTSHTLKEQPTQKRVVGRGKVDRSVVAVKSSVESGRSKDKPVIAKGGDNRKSSTRGKKTGSLWSMI